MKIKLGKLRNLIKEAAGSRPQSVEVEAFVDGQNYRGTVNYWWNSDTSPGYSGMSREPHYEFEVEPDSVFEVDDDGNVSPEPVSPDATFAAIGPELKAAARARLQKLEAEASGY